MADKWETYVKDPRTICKFGSKCYQKNPEHHKTYKHPPKMNKKGRITKRYEPYPKNHKQINKLITPVTNNDKPSSHTEQQQKDDQLFQVTDESMDEMLSYDKSSERQILKDLFLVDMPEDFYKFYDCLQSLDKPINETLASVNLELIGPFDLLLGRLPSLNNKDLYLIHWRYFYDPPEFQAVLKGKKEYHIGYFRDDPQKEPIFLASNDSSLGSQLKPLSDNIFGAVYFYLQMEKKSSPFASVACQKLIEKLQEWSKEFNYPLKEFDLKARLSIAVTKSFHGAGIVVPYDKRTKLGYRPLSDSDAQLKKMFSKLSQVSTDEEKNAIMTELQAVITNATLAMDECDFGTGLELGIDLFCSGLKELETIALNNLSTAYSLLKRDAFSRIIQTHMKYRRKGSDMSVMSLRKM